ncbi:uncharacterized protein LOC143212662 isoform X1 [Lasioglossum baleicum]|uniref:uncharacterized protein LOC143212662 isoform X1 n=1 Tax=Lasioglossum baleicum TaxID=434251 RepID=UPI003FCE5232
MLYRLSLSVTTDDVAVNQTANWKVFKFLPINEGSVTLKSNFRYNNERLIRRSIQRCNISTVVEARPAFSSVIVVSSTTSHQKGERDRTSGSDRGWWQVLR